MCRQKSNTFGGQWPIRRSSYEPFSGGMTDRTLLASDELRPLDDPSIDESRLCAMIPLRSGWTFSMSDVDICTNEWGSLFNDDDEFPW